MGSMTHDSCAQSAGTGGPDARLRASASRALLGRPARLGARPRRRSALIGVAARAARCSSSSRSPTSAPTARASRSSLDEFAALARRRAQIEPRRAPRRRTPSRSASSTTAATFSAAYPADGTSTPTLVDAGQRGRRQGRRRPAGRQGRRSASSTTFLLPLMILANLFALLFVAERAGRARCRSDRDLRHAAARARKGDARARRRRHLRRRGRRRRGGRRSCGRSSTTCAIPTRYAAVGAVPPKGVLLFGPPGCGKTLIARAVAGEAGVPFFTVAGAEFVESLVGVGAARVRDLFAKVREVAPAIVFIDELDAAARRRGAGGSQRRLRRARADAQPAARRDRRLRRHRGPRRHRRHQPPGHPRPGRRCAPAASTATSPSTSPTTRAASKILAAARAQQADRTRASTSTGLAKRTPGFTGADLANVINEAALLTVRERRATIEEDLLDEAVQRVLHGPQRRGRVLTAAERERAAIHESGHAIVAAAAGRAEDVHRVSILARGRGLGLTARAPGLRRRPVHARRPARPARRLLRRPGRRGARRSASRRPAPSRTSSTRRGWRARSSAATA